MTLLLRFPEKCSSELMLSMTSYEQERLSALKQLNLLDTPPQRKLRSDYANGQSVVRLAHRSGIAY